MNDIHLLKYIIKLSEEKSLSLAAKKLSITQPALSQQLRNLEEKLDTELFVRSKKELRLTDAGKVYVNGARAVLNVYEKALADIADLVEEQRTRMKLVSNDTLLPDFISRILPHFQACCPDISLSVISANTPVAKDYLTTGGADLGIMASKELSHSMLEFIPIRSEELQLMLPADSPLIPDFEKNGADMKKLDDTPVIIHQQNSFFQTLELSVFSDNGISPRILCEISDTLALINMVENHKGFAFIPRSISGSSSNVRCFSLENRVEFFIVMAYHKDTLLSDPMKALIKLILESYDPMSNRSSSLNGL